MLDFEQYPTCIFTPGNVATSSRTDVLCDPPKQNKTKKCYGGGGMPQPHLISNPDSSYLLVCLGEGWWEVGAAPPWYSTWLSWCWAWFLFLMALQTTQAHDLSFRNHRI